MKELTQLMHKEVFLCYLYFKYMPACLIMMMQSHIWHLDMYMYLFHQAS